MIGDGDESSTRQTHLQHGREEDSRAEGRRLSGGEAGGTREGKKRVVINHHSPRSRVE